MRTTALGVLVLVAAAGGCWHHKAQTAASAVMDAPPPGPGSRAADLARVCASAKQLTVGQWSTYSVQGAPRGAPKMRLATVGTEKQGDSTFYWFEITTLSNSDSVQGVTQLLVSSLAAPGTAVRGLIVRAGGQRARRVNDPVLGQITEQVAQDNPVVETVRTCEHAEAVQWDSVAVPAGSFLALHIRDDEGDGWLADSIPFGVVRLRGADAGEWQLTGRGMNARSQVGEIP